ncbi:MAG: hypothetical protein KGJ78_14285 [Alphaproteobacteria bacterium]|nr:hypothetical protein [Alphaproteobacteria bacterium]
MSHLRHHIVMILCLSLLTACDNSSPPKADAKPKPAEGVVSLSPDETAHLGIRTVAVAAAAFTPNIQGYGLIVSFDTLAQADSDVATAEAAARQSQASLRRQQHLMRSDATTREAVDLAQKQAATDAAQLVLAQRKEAATFGRTAPWLDPARYKEIMSKLSSGRTKLVHASFPIGVLQGAPPSKLFISRLDHAPTGAAWSSGTIWLAPADNTIPGRSVYALLEGSDLADGERVLVAAPVAPPVSGALIPTDAVILSEGQAWCYVVVRPNRFERVQVDTSRPMAGGYFVANGVGTGTKVVLQGQSLLLAHEQAPAAEAAGD